MSCWRSLLLGPLKLCDHPWSCVHVHYYLASSLAVASPQPAFANIRAYAETASAKPHGGVGDAGDTGMSKASAPGVGVGHFSATLDTQRTTLEQMVCALTRSAHSPDQAKSRMVEHRGRDRGC
jgi:hypothetical protein